MLSFIYNILIFIALRVRGGLKHTSFICIALCFSELEEMCETLSFICNYTDFVYVMGKMKHNERFPINKPLKMLSYGSSENFCTMRQLIVWFRNFPVNHTMRHRELRNLFFTGNEKKVGICCRTYERKYYLCSRKRNNDGQQ
jgi:hypothetical protein